MRQTTRIHSKDIDDLLSTLNIIRLYSDKDSFLQWLKYFHGIELYTKELFEGYKFFLINGFNSLIYVIEKSSSLGLSEDIVFYRTRFVDLKPSDIPNTSDKIVFAKNVLRFAKPVKKAKNWNGISKTYFKYFIKLYEKLYARTTPIKNIRKDEALKFVTMFYLYLYFHNAYIGKPISYISSMLTENIASNDYLGKVYLGYILTLQYLWYNLLGEDRFRSTSIRDLHRVYELYSSNRMISEENIEENMRKWLVFDTMFGIVKKEIIEPIEKQLQLNLSNEPLLSIDKVDKRWFRAFLTKRNLKEPIYLNKRNKSDIIKWLDYKFLWYKVEVLSTTMSIFSGVPAFIAVLIGLINLSREKIIVRVIKHPSYVEGHYNYSYAILIPVVGTVADYSGWLVFFDCATNYSGFGGSLYYQAKKVFESLRGKVDVEEIEVNKKLFREYLKQRSFSSIFEKIITIEYGALELSKFKKMIDNVKGLLFELIVLKSLYNKRLQNIMHNVVIENREFDLIIEETDKIVYYECKVGFYLDVERHIKNIIEKKNILQKKYPMKKVEVIFLVYNKVFPEIREKIIKKGVNVIDGFKYIIQKENLLGKDKIKLVKRFLEDKLNYDN